VMLSVGGKESRFTLLHLQEGEEYLKDFKGHCKFFEPGQRAEVLEISTIHFCTYSIIVEPDTPSLPIVKYLYSSLVAPPQLTEKKAGEKVMQLQCGRVVLIPAGKIPQPHQRLDLTTPNEQAVNIKLIHSTIDALFQAVAYLYGEVKKKLADVEYQSRAKTYVESDTFGKAVFDKTRIKDIRERPLLSRELRVMQIQPLVQIAGLLYLTNERIYFQPLHSFHAKPLLSFRLTNIVALYKRRYKLKPVGKQSELVAGPRMEGSQRPVYVPGSKFRGAARQGVQLSVGARRTGLCD
jgi:factor associated with neutral sphingomyelinase activation